MLKYKEISKSLQDEFLSLKETHISIDPITNCHNWLGMRDKHNYGYINEYVGKKKSLHYFVHRIAYSLSNPSVDISHKIVRHSCDNPSCCYPAHLLAGTQADNMQDVKIRSRRPKGLNAYNGRYSDETVKQIRQEFASGQFNYNQLGRKHNMDRRYVKLIIQNIKRYDPTYSPPQEKISKDRVHISSAKENVEVL